MFLLMCPRSLSALLVLVGLPKTETFDDVEEGPDEDGLLETKSWAEMNQEPDDPETTLPSTPATGTEQSNQC